MAVALADEACAGANEGGVAGDSVFPCGKLHPRVRGCWPGGEAEVCGCPICGPSPVANALGFCIDICRHHELLDAEIVQRRFWLSVELHVCADVGGEASMTDELAHACKPPGAHRCKTHRPCWKVVNEKSKWADHATHRLKFG